MIGVIFQFGNEIIETRINGNAVFFRNSSFGSNFVTIDYLNLSKDGVLKEFPDLKDDELWKQKAIERFKNKIKNMKSEEEIEKYITEDLIKYGYVPKYRQKSGFRPEVING
jgi:prolyl-tRNA synthetase